MEDEYIEKEVEIVEDDGENNLLFQEMDFILSELDYIDHKILRIMLLPNVEGGKPRYSQEEIGKIVGLSRMKVSERVNAPAFKYALEEWTKRSTLDALQRYKADQVLAVEELRNLLKNKSPQIRLGAVRLYIQGMIVSKHLIFGDKKKPIPIQHEGFISDEDRSLFREIAKEFLKRKIWDGNDTNR